MPYVQDTLGATSVGTVGTCWGSYLVVHASTYSLVKAGFSAHPAHPQTQEGFGESEEETYQAINDNNNAAQFFNPTEGDSDTLRPGGLASQTLNVVGQAMIHVYFLACQVFASFSLKSLSEILRACTATSTGATSMTRRSTSASKTPF